MPMITGSSNFTISGSARLYEIHGNPVINHSTDTNELKKTQPIVNLPRAQASLKDYETKKKTGPCFPGTREALLRELIDWVNELGESKMYILSGLAGIGKSTVAYTLATRADQLGLLGASFFFSRDGDDRNNAKKFFTTIAFQLCVYDEAFAKAIGDVLLTERGSAATTQDPQEQLKLLILNPLESIVRSRARPIVVVDALDECEEEDKYPVVMGLSQLVQLLKPFKVILTTRPKPLDNYLFGDHDNHSIFHLQDIEDKVVDGDIRLYLKHVLSQEQVQIRYPKREWHANDEDIDSLVRTTGRLFIVASTAVRYIFDKLASNPAAQMQKLLHAFAQDHTPFTDLGNFYTIILRDVIPEDCDNDDIINRYKSVVGAIIFVQYPLSVSSLAHLIGTSVDVIRAVLDHLQSVILLDSDDVPRIYHKSFPDYLTDQARCKDTLIQIDSTFSHKLIAGCCFEIMGKLLKYNILGLGDPARFMSNEDGLKKDQITDEQLLQKIPQQLRYACVYLDNHLEVATIEDVGLMNGLEKFVNEHMLHWFEVLSLIGKLDSAPHVIHAALKLLVQFSPHLMLIEKLTGTQKSTPPVLQQLLSDALRFISKFYEVIERSALHTYYSALPFAPTNTILYHQYIKEAEHSICTIEGGKEKWDALVSNMRHEGGAKVIKFSLDSTLFASYSYDQTKLKVWNATIGTPISMIPGHKFAVANDFSTVASSENNIIAYHNINGSPRGTALTASSEIEKLALSAESSRVVAALSDGTVCIWDSRDRGMALISTFHGFTSSGYWPELLLSSTGTRLAYSLANGDVKLLDVINGRFITDLQCGSEHYFVFSGDGSRLASLSREGGLRLWNSESGTLISAIREVDPSQYHRVGRDDLAISANGSLLATQPSTKDVTLWNGTLSKLEILEDRYTRLMTFSLDNILALASYNGVTLYDVKSHTFISTLTFSGSPVELTFSPDSTRLALGNDENIVYLWDIRGIKTSGTSSYEERAGTLALNLSRDCSQLACTFRDGRVELWGTNPIRRQITSSQSHRSVRALSFTPDGGLFAARSDDGIIKLFNGTDGSLRGTIKAPYMLPAVALSNKVLAAAGHDNITLWSLDTLSLIYTLDIPNREAIAVSIAENSCLIGFVSWSVEDHQHLIHQDITIFDVVKRTTVAVFDSPLDKIQQMSFLPDNSRFIVQTYNGVFLSFSLIDKCIVELNGPALKYLIQQTNIPRWHSVPIWCCEDNDNDQHLVLALFSQHKDPILILWIPKEFSITTWTQGLSMIALGCADGRIILLRIPPT